MMKRRFIFATKSSLHSKEKPKEVKRVEVNYEINLPHGTEIELRNAGSRIERPSIKGRWIYHSANGRFSIKNE
jgi:hypothetical protein